MQTQVPRLSGLYAVSVVFYKLKSTCFRFNVNFAGVSAVQIDDAADGSDLLPLADANASDATLCLEIQSDDDAVATYEAHEPDAASQAAVVEQSRQRGAHDCGLTRQEVRSLPREDLEQLCLRQQNILASQNKQMVAARPQLKAEKKKTQAAARQSRQSLALVGKLQKEQDPFALVKKGRQKDGRGGRLSTQAMYSIGVRRCMTSIASAGFGIVAMFDVSGQTVIRCEQRTAAGLLYCMQSHIAEGLNLSLQSRQMEVTDSWSLMAVAYRSDATNSSVWRRSKLHVVEASVLFISDSKL